MFKVGDEVCVPVKILEYDREYNDYKVEFVNGAFGRYDASFLSDVNGKTYTQGLADAWELARKISLAKYGYTNEQIKEIFGVVFAYEALSDFTAEEALAKIEAYEKEKSEIKVGDVIKYANNLCVVVSVFSSTVNALYEDGSTINMFISECKKTGKHIDIEGLLKQIGE